jgi:hypothetical protein
VPRHCYAGFVSIEHRLPLSNLSPGKYLHGTRPSHRQRCGTRRSEHASIGQRPAKIIVKRFTFAPAPVSELRRIIEVAGGSMLRKCLRYALSLLLVTVTLPVLAVSFLIAALCTAAVAVVPGLLKRHDRHAIALHKLRVVDQFNFEEAMSAYEELIGAHVTRQR